MRLIDKIRQKKEGLAVYDEFYGELVYPKLEGLLKNRMLFKGREVITWSFNDYLGYQCDQRVIEAETAFVSMFGAGYPAGSRLLTGNTEYHEKLEDEIAQLVGKPTMLVNLGYAGIMSTIQSLVDRNDTVIYDQEVHACLVDGARLHLGKRRSFRHNDIEHLEAQLKASKSALGGTLVLVDGVYSMRGDCAALSAIIELKKRYEFTLLVDDAHGWLTFSNQGSVGDLMKEVDIYIATFAKAAATVGGFIAADKDIIQHLKYNVRSQVFGRTLQLVNVYSVLFKLDLIRDEGDNRRNTLWSNTKKLQTGLQSIGLNIGDTTSPITPVYFDCPEEVSAEIIQTLRYEYGIFCSCVTYPVIPKGRFILRLIVTALHTDDDIKQTLKAFSYVKERLSRNVELS
ncbi:aminotransferase class I/II-fold pyridoxal phosphate-dependent enzyme [Tunicatimonas pelagia]|uniref:aminotransferase class I/II-fold pyridoxal phosphate-dependent enzyme n=1 Tax=Tunicatimonas pelagia TaxID=931531 RepID=UPI002665169E|nr:pyridoxal phosphate-dependent aminotransferase family protein [Tunicatimonas pelagia]WKN46516.1 pyridoxal phosphate-dependent aminotransferase family protein [Tunicatimonas pelagia]